MDVFMSGTDYVNMLTVIAVLVAVVVLVGSVRALKKTEK